MNKFYNSAQGFVCQTFIGIACLTLLNQKLSSSPNIHKIDPATQLKSLLFSCANPVQQRLHSLHKIKLFIKKIIKAMIFKFTSLQLRIVVQNNLCLSLMTVKRNFNSITY